jgi:hypothetical protein
MSGNNELFRQEIVFDSYLWASGLAGTGPAGSAGGCRAGGEELRTGGGWAGCPKGE